MADQPKRISELPLANNANLADLFIVDQPDGRSRALSLDKIRILLDTLGVTLTAAGIVAALEGLTGTDRLSASAIRDLPSNGTGVARTNFAKPALNGLSISGAYFGDTEPAFSSDGAGSHAISLGANVDWLNLDGNNTALDGDTNLVITLFGTNRRFTWDVVAANTEEDQNEALLGLSIKQDRSGANMIITIGGLSGFGTNGFTVVLS